MSALVYRTIALLLRFACPLTILYVSSSEIMGKYYLFSSFYTFCVFLTSLETAIPFSRTFLRTKGELQKQKIFSIFVTNSILLSFFLAIPLVIFQYWTTSISPICAILFALTIATGSCVNEVGRFFWNVGQSHVASRRDFWTSFGFLAAIVSSAIVFKEIISPLSFSIIVIFNCLLLRGELKGYGNGLKFYSSAFNLKRLLRRAIISVKESSPQVVHIQILSLYPFLERLLIERKLGLSMVGSYSLSATMIQSGLGLLLTPKIFKVRKEILSGDNEAHQARASKTSLHLLWVTFLVGIAGVVASYFFIPMICLVTKKQIVTSWAILFTALFSTVSSIYANAVSPSYAKKSRLLVSNISTLIAMLPLMIFIFFELPSTPSPQGSVMIILSISALAQLLIRCSYYLNSITKPLFSFR